MASLPPLSPAATTTSPVGPNAIVSSATPALSAASSASVSWAAAAIASVCEARWLSRSALVRASSALSSSLFRFISARSSSSSSDSRSPALPPRPSASSSMAASARAPGVLVDVGDDVQGEVQDPLEVARADVEQDPEPARRALEVPDVADRAGQLDVAHPLTTDLGARDLDAALVADDALVADPLVLAAVALPVLGRTEDALVEQAVLLGLERPVVDGLGLGHLALGPLPDLVRAGERNADRAEVIDFEHGSPPRRRLARQRDADRERAGSRRSERGPASGGSGSGSKARAADQSSNPARLIPPRSGRR